MATKRKMSTGAIVGIILGVVASLVVLTAVFAALVSNLVPEPNSDVGADVNPAANGTQTIVVIGVGVSVRNLDADVANEVSVRLGALEEPHQGSEVSFNGTVVWTIELAADASHSSWTQVTTSTQKVSESNFTGYYSKWLYHDEQDGQFLDGRDYRARITVTLASGDVFEDASNFTYRQVG